MRALVSGASGRIGQAFLAHIPKGVEVETLLSPRSPDIGFPWYRTDIADREKTVMAATCAAPDVLVHLAAMTDVDGCERDPERAFRVNRDGAAHLAEACAKCGAAMAYVSTDFVFDGRSGPYSETDEPNPVNAYGRSKLEGERAAAELTAALAVVRISVPFGAKAHGVGHNYVSYLDEKLSLGEEVRAVTDQLTTPSWLDELAEFLWKAVFREERGIIHYGASDRLSRHEMALELCRIRGYDKRLAIPVVTQELGLRAPRPLESGFTAGRAAAILGRPPIMYGEAIRRMTAKRNSASGTKMESWMDPEEHG